MLTNPPPSAGGTLLALALGLLDRTPGPPRVADIVDAMATAQEARTDAFVEGLAEPGFLDRFLSSRLGGTTHISVVDGEGRAASVTCTNGEGSGIVVPGTGVHVNNIMGEEDLSPLGFHTAPPGRRMPSMMAPTVVLRDDEVELVVGSAGSNRIRSALLQTIVGVVDHGLDARAAVEAPRAHFEDGLVYAEPGVPVDELTDREIVAFRESQPLLRRRAGRGARQRHRRGHRRRRPAPRRRGRLGMRRLVVLVLLARRPSPGAAARPRTSSSPTAPARCRARSWRCSSPTGACAATAARSTRSPARRCSRAAPSRRTSRP